MQLLLGVLLPCCEFRHRAAPILSNTRYSYDELAFFHTQNQLVHHHHEGEEKYYFPFFQQKLGGDAMTHNVAQHHTFQNALIAFEDLISVMREGKKPFSADEVCDGVNAFMPVLYEHLGDEIGTLNSENMRRHMSKEDLVAFEKTLAADLSQGVSMVRDPPMIIVNGDGKDGAW